MDIEMTSHKKNNHLFERERENWTLGKNKNLYYALRSQGFIGVYLTASFYSFGFGVNFYYHQLYKDDPRIFKVIINFLFFTANLTLHSNEKSK